MTGVKAKDSEWHELPPPSSATDRIKFLQTCQNVFNTHRAPEPGRTALRTTSNVACKVPSSCIASADTLSLSKKSTFSCITCGAASQLHENAVIMGNTYSKWLILQCERCASSSGCSGDRGTDRKGGHAVGLGR